MVTFAASPWGDLFEKNRRLERKFDRKNTKIKNFYDFVGGKFR